MPKQRTPQNDVPEPNKGAGAGSISKDTQANNTAKPAGTTESSRQEEVALATEQPVPSVPEEKVSQYVVTVDNQTGLVAKVEKLTATGERKELSQEEYEQTGLLTAAGEKQGSELSSADNNSLLTAYYQGVADYLNNLT